MGITSFIGEFEYSVDTKGRVNIPAKFRKALPESSEDTFVVTRGSTQNIVAYSLTEWMKKEDEYIALSTLNPTHRNFIRIQTRHATTCKCDSQGRIAIPQRLPSFANIDHNVLIIGMLSEIEIWDPNTFKTFEQSDFQLSKDDYLQVANYMSEHGKKQN